MDEYSHIGALQLGAVTHSGLRCVKLVVKEEIGGAAQYSFGELSIHFTGLGAKYPFQGSLSTLLASSFLSDFSQTVDLQLSFS